MADVIALMERLHGSGIKETGVAVELTYYGDAWAICWFGCNGEDLCRGTLEECVEYAEKALEGRR